MSELYKQANSFIYEKLTTLFFGKKSDQMEKFKQTFEGEDVMKDLTSFYNNKLKKFIVFSCKGDGGCIVVNSKETKVAKKGVLVLRVCRSEVLSPEMEKNFIFIETSRQVFDQLLVICSDIFYPMLAQTVYQGDTSELISRDLMEKFHNFLAHYFVCSGHMKGKTQLPVPSDEIFRNMKINDNEKTQICEGAVVMWIELIKHILKQEPENAFRNSALPPNPLSEIEFWKNKSSNLQSIINQIKGEKINDILKFLEKQKSTYHKFFTEIKKEVMQKEKEATQNYNFLSFLSEEFSTFSSDSSSLTDLAELFVPIFHTIRMIWRDNEYYNKPERLIILIKKICNSLIENATAHINKNIFTTISNKELVAKEAIGKLETTREIINKFMVAYFMFKDSDQDGWKITRNVIFFRLDAFNDRVGDILNVARSYAEFCKLEDKAIGGIRGQAMMTVLNNIFIECTDAVKEFQKPDDKGKEYSPLDINSDVFHKKYIIYKETLKELERRVAAVLTQCFDDVDTIVGKFKVLEVFDTILERPNIVIELEKKYNYLLEQFKQELRNVQFLFLTGKDYIEHDDERSPLNKNMQPIAAILSWTDSLKERIKEPFERFTNIGKRITEKEEFREIEILYNSIFKMIVDYENSKKAKWDFASKSNSGDKQKEFILKKNKELIHINFDPELLKLLKEIKYLKILNLSIPDEAEKVYAKNSIFRKQIANLENIVSLYNNMINSLHDVEKPLVESKLSKLAKIIEPGFMVITWENTKEIEDFVVKASNAIADLNGIVEKLHLFVSKIENVLNVWKENKLFSRPKLSNLNDMDQNFSANFDSERGSMVIKSKDISNLTEVNNALKSVISNPIQFRDSHEWKNYQHYINSIIINGFIDTIYNNLDYLNKSLDPNSEPICYVQLDLEERKLIFSPLLEGDEKYLSLKTIIVKWINLFLNLGTVNKNRVDTGGGDYMLEILESFKIQEIVYRLYNEVNTLISECQNVINSFGDFKILWEKDFEEAFTEFLKLHSLRPEETLEQQERNERIKKIFPKGNPILEEVVENTPSKEFFDDKINEFKIMLRKVKSMEEKVKIRWIQVSFMLFKNNLENIIQNWIKQYKDFLNKNSTNKIKNIDKFMKDVKTGISINMSEIKDENQRKKFYSILENIRNMKYLNGKIVEIIPTIKGELEVLKKYSRSDEGDEEENEEREQNSAEQKLIVRTDEISKELDKLNKEVEEKNVVLNPLIESESANFKEKVKKFEEEVQNFRENFIKNVPNKLEKFNNEEIESAYQKLDMFYDKVLTLDNTRKENNNTELLLNLQVSNNKQINDCLNDLQQLKVLWDYCLLFNNTFENWKKQKMEKVNPNELLEKIDIMKNMLRKNPVRKDIKNHSIYNALSKRIDDMDNTINVTSILKDKVIKNRHWKHLMEVTGKTIPYDNPDFSIDNIIKLGLFNFKEKIEEEKTIAAAQEKIEMEYNKIEKYWKIAVFRMTNILNAKEYEFNLFDHILMEGVIEILEKDQNILIQMLQKKTMLDNFEGMDDKIQKYKDKLSTVNKVLKIWLKFQKNWEKLETIFLKSDDIQKTLQEHYRKFKELDIKFKEEMKNASDYNIIIDSCVEEKYIILYDLFTTIKECEQALDNYLNDKKKIFPRFYFLSNDTLLNMLSFGDYPNKINKNVKDCFDGIKEWAMTEVNAKNFSNRVLGMFSSDNDEEVYFDEPFICTGLVEMYLLNFEEKMRRTMRDILYKSRFNMDWANTYKTPKNNIPRHTWLDPYPAQIALLVTQNIWTEEVEEAFNEMEGGTEGAMKDFLLLNRKRIDFLIDRVKGEPLTLNMRVKIITIITVDVHARDVVEYFVDKKISDLNNFNWSKQLRFKYDFKDQDATILIADFSIGYSYEYIGNTGRLVITPLTDRCYITLTQALNLVLGGAPAGPAGTGKTETTKDLGRNLGLGVIVNNCSEQMDIDTTARIFAGLAQTGFWGCFDEFNRISIEVLSVVSTQVKCVLDAMKEKSKMFLFEGQEIRLVHTVGFFITMNPGYAGRTELPENLKALFRSCAMVVPDLMLICENMLMSEGFKEAKTISRKFITLYTLSRDLLSKQKHYDWGLRAIKSLLRQAGGLKRHPLNASKPEDFIIMRALFDFNKAKIVPDDLQIFNRLLEVLFPAYSEGKSNVKEEDTNQELDDLIKIATESKEVNLQEDKSFTLKTRQLFEILGVRHCCFILGAPGCGKTSVWRTLFHTLRDGRKEESLYDKLSPKAITGNELLGAFNDAKVWRYGILSSIMKKMCKNEPPYKSSMKNKWVILDGDVDPDWIESLNTVMDDNKVLTLVNGDRFPLDKYMRLLFEISNLRNATPATASRGGVLFISESDIGINPFFEKWIKSKYSSQKHEITRSVIKAVFKETFTKTKDNIQDKLIAPMVDMCLVQSICTIFQYLVEENNLLLMEADDDKKKLIIEGIYYFSFMWSMGGCLKDRKEIHSVVKNGINNKIRIPDNGICFDYFFDPKTLAWINWSNEMKDFQIADNTLFQQIIVPTVEVIRLCKVMEICVREEKPVLFIGDAGTGKTALVKYFLSGLDNMKHPEGYQYKYYSVNFNSFTDSYVFQQIIESQIEVKIGTTFAPPGQVKLLYFLDDINMPGMDKYGTQSHVELLRQMFDYHEFFDRKDLEILKKLLDILFIACQNPKAGSFNVDLRLQRHFCLLSTSEPKKDIITDIYMAILRNHYKNFKFINGDSIEKLCEELIKASVEILEKIRLDKQFTPSATKFHYQWNLREIAKIVEGLLRTKSEVHKNMDQIYRLWLHECNRIFKDRLKFAEDSKKYDELATSTFDSFKYNGLDKKAEVTEPFIFVPFDETMEDTDNHLVQAKTYDDLKAYINYKLEEYQESKSLPLVLFDDAIMHVCRINRIISNPSSHALLIGVGGSGKQSLTKLASFIKAINVYSIVLTGTDYNSEKLLEDLKTCIRASCLKPSASPHIFMMTDNHILKEFFLVYINNFLASSWVDQLYETKQDLENDLNKIKTPAVSEGFMKSTEFSYEKIFNYLIYRIKINMHMVLCMSPVGDTLRVRARKFPGILNCTNIDWFHDWPDIALESVAKKNIESLEKFTDDEVIKISRSTSGVHKSIKEMNDLFFVQERRYNYTTPKSYLELIKFYTSIVTTKSDEIENQVNRLQKGLDIVKKTGEQIAVLKKEIEVKSAEVKIQVDKTNEFLVELNAQTILVNDEKFKVEGATEIAIRETEEAERNEKNANEALAEAEPIKMRAKDNAEKLDPKGLNEFKNQSKPSENAVKIFELLFLIFNPKDKVPDLNTIKAKCLNIDANAIKKQLLNKLENIDWLDDDFLKKVDVYRKGDWVNDAWLLKISLPAFGVCKFFHNCCTYKVQYDRCRPLKELSEAAKKKAQEATAKKDELVAKLNLVTAQAKQLQEKFDEQKSLLDSKLKEEGDLKAKLSMAEKFIGLLAGNNKRWGEEVVKLKSFRVKLAGDCLLASAFVSYTGVFNSYFREKIISKWKTIIAENNILVTTGVDIVSILVTPSMILKFKSQGLPDDPFSKENSAIMTSCTRWPLVIDPQMQALKWLKGIPQSKIFVQNKQKEWESLIGNAVTAGQMIIIEDIDQEMDPMMTPILGKETTKKDKTSKQLYIKVGTEDYEYNEKCKIYLITKMANPHYKPEIIAQCTLINFIVTEKGLEDQLLALVVNIEAPELEDSIKKCLEEINEFQSELILKEDDVLRRLSEANSDTILENIELVQSLESTKARAQEIEEKSKKTETLIAEINEKREKYRKIGEEGAMLFFIISKLFVVQYMYQYSLESFVYFFTKAINETPKSEKLEDRLVNLRETIRVNIYKWVTSGMFERDKQLFLTMIALRLIQKGALKELTDINSAHIEYLLKCPFKEASKDKTLDWLDDKIWWSMNALTELPGFAEFAPKMEKEQYTKFKEWFNEINPEDQPLPPDWKGLKVHDFKKILVLRCCRPDRVSVALNEFVRMNIPRGKEFLEARVFMDVLTQAYLDSTPEVPIFFILSPGSNPIKALETLGKTINPKKKFELNKTLWLVSMGQKMDILAEKYLKTCNNEGHWLFLQNIHLMPSWLKKLQDRLKELAKEKGNDDFRLFLSAEPTKEIPVGLLEKSIKLTNEPPSGLKENMKIAFYTIKNENPLIDDRRRMAVIFGLCYFHSVVLERKKFGSLGWNRNYPFNIDDLKNSESVVAKYLEKNPGSKIPWDDLRYIIGEIMYGGHIVDDWDRRLSTAYLEFLLVDKINEDLDLIPYMSSNLSIKLSLKTPINHQVYTFDRWGEYIENTVTSESPALFGLHPNAELDFRIQQNESLFQKLLDLQPKDSGGAGGEETEQSKFERIKTDADIIQQNCSDGCFNIVNMLNMTGEDRNPFQNVFIQECEQMKILCEIIKKNTVDIKDAIEGKLTMTEAIESLIDCLRLDRVPPKWIADGFASTRKLGSWLKSLQYRIDQYKIFADDSTTIPKVVFINRLFNPLSYLTAIKQVHAQANKSELDKLIIETNMTSIDLRNGVDNLNLPKDGYPIYGMHLQGCRWDDEGKFLDDSKPREDYCVLPVINCKVLDNTAAKLEENKSLYFCPVYKTIQRDISYVFTAQFKTKASAPPAKWIIAGVACILDVEKTDAINKYPK